MENLRIYEEGRAVPENAKKQIVAGRLKGMTDINPMWRIKKLTEMFGPCGLGWYYEITEKWIDTSMANEEITASVRINLYYKLENEWSKPVVGIGGSKLVSSERSGPYTNDECYKMALTDAISVACKALGIGADVYWKKDNTKYDDEKSPERQEADGLASETEKKIFLDRCTQLGVDYKEIGKSVGAKSMKTMTKEQQGKALIALKEIEEARMMGA